MAALSERLTQLLEPVVNALGYELLLLEFSPHRGRANLRLYIDWLDGGAAGIGLDDCEKVSREVAAALDVADPIPHAYRLEVSSPGLDRPLVKPAHFRRFCGAQVRVQTLVPVAGRQRFQGVLAQADETAVVLRTSEGSVRVPLADIERARLVPDFGSDGGARHPVQSHWNGVSEP
jgi:ribosome maturation factor RimP